MNSNRILYIKLVLVALFFGSTFIAGHVIAAQVPPFTAAFLRFLTASLMLLYFVLRKEGTLPSVNLKQVGLFLLLGFSGMAGYNYFFFSGLSMIDASRASMIIAGNPVAIALLSALVFGERLSFKKILGILISVSGALAILSRGNFLSVLQSGVERGDLYILGCVGCWAVFTILGKFAMRDLTPLVVTLYACLAGTATLFFLAFSERQFSFLLSYGPSVWISVFVLGFLGTALGFTWYYQGIDVLGSSNAGVFINFVPVFATIMAVIILHETLSWYFLLGAALVISGVTLTNRG
ncbi:MAG: DMT family transporter [Bacillota bacterium]|nr:DMT family transporter [Bacillota bacterium]